MAKRTSRSPAVPIDATRHGLAEPFAHRGLRVGGRQSPFASRVLETDVVPVDEQHAWRRRTAGDDDGVVPGELARYGEVAGREGVGEEARERGLRDHGELRTRRQRCADQR